jgi:hypothetical protein
MAPECRVSGRLTRAGEAPGWQLARFARFTLPLARFTRKRKRRSDNWIIEAVVDEVMAGWKDATHPIDLVLGGRKRATIFTNLCVLKLSCSHCPKAARRDGSHGPSKIALTERRRRLVGLHRTARWRAALQRIAPTNQTSPLGQDHDARQP